MFTIACPCHFGLESVLSGELRRMGAQNITVQDGRVDFTGDARTVAAANIRLRTAERVQLVVGSYTAKSFTELFDGAAALPWEDYLASADAFPVTGWCVNSQLMSVPDSQSILKKAVAKRLGAHYGIQWLEESGPLHQIRFSIHRDVVTLMLDTTGDGLHKRGYRKVSGAAPIKETLAAGIADLARVRPDSRLIDPMCGSGTLLIEAAMWALRIPPGAKRRFTAEGWGLIPAELWGQERERALAERREGTLTAQGSDLDPAMIKLAQENAALAGVGERLRAVQADVARFRPPEYPFTLLCNPPYGERMLDTAEVQRLYQTMGRVFAPGEGRSYYIITPDRNFEALFGRPAQKRRKLYNGMLNCQLYMFY